MELDPQFTNILFTELNMIFQGREDIDLTFCDNFLLQVHVSCRVQRINMLVPLEKQGEIETILFPVSDRDAALVNMSNVLVTSREVVINEGRAYVNPINCQLVTSESKVIPFIGAKNRDLFFQ